MSKELKKNSKYRTKNANFSVVKLVALVRMLQHTNTSRYRIIIIIKKIVHNTFTSRVFAELIIITYTLPEIAVNREATGKKKTTGSRLVPITTHPIQFLL